MASEDLDSAGVDEIDWLTPELAGIVYKTRLYAEFGVGK